MEPGYKCRCEKEKSGVDRKRETCFSTHKHRPRRLEPEPHQTGEVHLICLEASGVTTTGITACQTVTLLAGGTVIGGALLSIGWRMRGLVLFVIKLLAVITQTLVALVPVGNLDGEVL
jgi:hypothetical protein